LPQVISVLRKLVEYTKYHFKLEEDLFERFNYKNTSDHIEKHIKFINELSDLITEYTDGGIMTPRETLSFLRDWLISHIGKEDKKYVKCFKENGVK
jgi:hemerythrin